MEWILVFFILFQGFDDTVTVFYQKWVNQSCCNITLDMSWLPLFFIRQYIIGNTKPLL